MICPAADLERARKSSSAQHGRSNQTGPGLPQQNGSSATAGKGITSNWGAFAAAATQAEAAAGAAQAEAAEGCWEGEPDLSAVRSELLLL